MNFQSSGKGSNSSSEHVGNPVSTSKDDSLDKKQIVNNYPDPKNGSLLKNNRL